MKYIIPIINVDEQRIIFFKELFIVIGLVLLYVLFTDSNLNKPMYMYVPFIYTLSIVYINYSHFITTHTSP